MTAFTLDNVGVRVATTGTGSPLALGEGIEYGRSRLLTFIEGGAVDGIEYAYKIQDGIGWEMCSGVYSASADTITRITTKSFDGQTVSASPLDLSGRATIVCVLRASDYASIAAVQAALDAASAASIAASASSTAAAASAAAAAASAAAADPSSRVQRAGDTMTGALNWATAVTVASATTTDIGAAASNYVIVSGTVTITGLGTKAQGAERIVRFSGALLLTYNASSLILPGAANITTVAGDVAVFVSEGSGNWRCVSYERSSGAPILTGTSGLVLTGTGVGVPSTMQAIPLQLGTLLSTLTASNSASLADTSSWTAAYDCYVIALENVLPATNGVTLRMRVDIGSGYATTAYVNGGAGGAATDCISLGTSVPNSGIGVAGWVVFTRPASALCPVTGVVSSGAATPTTVSGYYNTAGTITGVQFSMSSGNITSGKIRIYGVKTS